MINSAIAGLATQSALDTATQTITNLTTRLNTVCTAIKNVTAAVDPDGAGPLPQVAVPVSFPGITAAGACGP
jgi:hypothetical protein